MILKYNFNPSTNFKVRNFSKCDVQYDSYMFFFKKDLKIKACIFFNHTKNRFEVLPNQRYSNPAQPASNKMTFITSRAFV